MEIALSNNSWISKLARAGLVSKGVVYLLLGGLAFMAASGIGGTSSDDTNKEAALGSVRELPGGLIILILLALGLACYSIWRLIQAFAGNSRDMKWTKRVRYFSSGVIYLLLAATATQMIFANSNGDGNQDQYWIAKILQQPAGQYLVIIGAVILAGIGIYQVYYGLSEKYRKHVQELSVHNKASNLLLTAGKIGYVARGIVWLIIAYLCLLAGLHKSSREAGDRVKAFDFIESSPYGSYMLAALGLGLIAYGVFNFIRARYETFR